MAGKGEGANEARRQSDDMEGADWESLASWATCNNKSPHAHVGCMKPVDTPSPPSRGEMWWTGRKGPLTFSPSVPQAIPLGRTDCSKLRAVAQESVSPRRPRHHRHHSAWPLTIPGESVSCARLYMYNSTRDNERDKHTHTHTDRPRRVDARGTNGTLRTDPVVLIGNHGRGEGA